MSTLLFKSIPTMTFDRDSRCDISTITSKSVDLQGDIIEPQGLDWTPFYDGGSKVNLSHSSIVVGRALWVKAQDGKVIAKTQYEKSPDNWPVEKVWYPDVVFEAVCKGVMPGKSLELAFSSDNIREPSKAEAEAGAKRVITKAFVNEFSVCRRPVNPDAVIQEVQKALDEIINPRVLSEDLDKRTLIGGIEGVFERLKAGGW